MKRKSFDTIFQQPILTAIKHRFPWLLIGLFGGMLTASIVESFKKVLSQNLILAAFIPLIVYMADAVGTQMEAFIIRDLATSSYLRFSAYFFRQTLILLIIGSATSLILYAVSLMIYQQHIISLVLGLALFFAIFSSLVTGLVVPYLFAKYNLDPADASGPVATIIQDMLSILIYFYIASLFLYR